MRVLPTLLFVLLFAFLKYPARGESNDRMYPPSTAAKAAIDIDGRGFIIHGERTYVASGSIHYARVPHELWHDRLLRLKQASFNCVQTYAFWNFHEPRENAFDFTGDKDIGGFLHTAQQLGLYATVRPGPYVCAEWDSGGYPIWLKFKPPMRVRTDDPQFLALNDHWYDKILPLVAAHQIHRGGNVIMVQLENEHPNGWGVIAHSPYFEHLENKAQALGIEVPHFMSGLHHGGGPKPEDADTSKRVTPWFSTEFWSGWFDLYGPLSSKRLREIESDNWSIMARGGAGQNFYMLHGGSNFDTWNDPSGAASYDYGAAIGQAGDLRPIYYRMKRANQVAESFSDILADGTDAAAEYKDFATGAQIAGARRSAAGTLLFIRNPAPTEGIARLKDGGSITMEKSETFALPRDASIGAGLKIANSSVRVLAVARYDNTVTVVVYGKPGESGDIVFTATKPLKIEKAGGRSINLDDPLHPRVTFVFPKEFPDGCTLTDGGRRLRVVAVSSDLSLYTWLLGAKGKQSVVVGPQFVSDFAEKAGKPSLLIERSYGMPSCGQVVIYGKGDSQNLAVNTHLERDALAAPDLEDWRMSVSREQASDFDDSKWKTSEDPAQMGADGDTSAFAWYRSHIEVPSAGNGTLRFDGADNVSVFINGQRAANSKHHDAHWEVEIPLSAGRNVLAVFTSHAGREKAFSYLGTLNDYHSKGIFGAVTLTLGGNSLPVKNWRMRGGVDPAAPPASGWTAVGDTKGAPSLFRAAFRANRPGEVGHHPIYRVTYAGLSRGTVWLNGHNLGRYPEKIRISSLYLPECWLKDGPNALTIFDETGSAPAKVELTIETAASREVIRVEEPADPNTPIVVPGQDAGKEIASLNKGNLALGRPVTASSSEARNPAEAATDGDADSRWCAAAAKMGQWLKVDLGAATEVTTCEIVWEQASRLYHYVLEGSGDGQSWTRLGDDSTAVPQSPDSPSQLSRVNFGRRPIRYARVTVIGTASAKQWASICELRLLNEQ